MKANLKSKLRKLRKNLKNLICSSKNKSNNCRRFRPGKQTSTLRKEVQRMNKLKRDFHKQGLGVFKTWTELFDEVSVELGAPK
jgi:hypothetical protein